MKLTKESLKKLIKEELGSLSESLAFKAYYANAFGGQKNLDKWGALYAKGGAYQNQAIEIAKTLLGDDNWEQALIYAAGGSYMTDKQKELSRAAGHSQYARETEKMFQRNNLRKTIGQSNYDKLSSMGQRLYTLPKHLTPDEADQHNAMISQRDSFLDALGKPRDIFQKSFLSRKEAGSPYEYDDHIGTTVIEDLGADFVFSVLSNPRVQRITDFDYGSIEVQGGYNAGRHDGEISLADITIFPQMKEDPDTNEPLEYDFSGEFAIAVGDTEDYYNPEVDSEEEMIRRLEDQLTSVYGH